MKKRLNLIVGLLLGTFCGSTQNLYDINSVTIIELKFEDPNWDQTMDNHYSNDLGERLLASCLVNGIPYDSVGVKFKGESTYEPSNQKNPLNIKLNHRIDNQDYDGWYTLKLSSGEKDPSFVREALSYEILRKYMVAPLSNFAKVYINGNYYGLFTSNESINKKFVSDYFISDKDNTLIKCNWEVYLHGGSSLEYLGIDSTSYFDSYELKSDHGWNDLVNLTESINSNFSQAEEILNIDRAIWMLAFNNVLVNLDSYSGPFRQNYYLYKDDHGIISPIVWDLNMSFAGFRAITLGGSLGGATTNQALQEMEPLLRLGDESYPLINMILSDSRYQKMYIAHCRTILKENFSNNHYFERAETLQNLIFDDYDSDPSKIFSTLSFTSNLNTTVAGGGGLGNGPYLGLSQLMSARIQFLQQHAEFQKPPPTIEPFNLSSATSNSSVNLNVSVLNSNYVTLGYRNSPSEPFTKVEMFDDGNHNDGESEDGIYGINIDVGVSNVQYYFYAENDEAGVFSPQRAEHEFHELAVAGDIVINEILASNSSVSTDQDGDYDDWIELYNNTSSPVDISGYSLSDNKENLSKWSFPNGIQIGANDYLMIWADNHLTQPGLHSNFKLSSSGEALYLTDDSGSLIDELIFPLQSSDVSFGRFPNGVGVFTLMPPTFNADNQIYPITTKIDKTKRAPNISLYPNPLNNYFKVEFESNDEEHLRVVNAMGQLIYNEHVVSGIEIDASNWSEGIYFVKLANGLWSKVIKNNYD